jgi:hypothetical protein
LKVVFKREGGGELLEDDKKAILDFIKYKASK